jgi:hypothetical protein
MPIHNNEAFNEFLTSMTLRQPESAADFERFEAVPGRLLSDLSARSISEPVYLWCRKGCPLAPNTMLEQLCKELRWIGHTSTPEMARAILAMSCLTSSTPQSPVGRLNTMLEMIGPADSSQFWIFPYPPYPGMNTFRLGRFTIGSLNRERLVYRCNKMGCDYFNRYPNQFFNRFAIEGAPVSVQVFDWSY